MNWQIKVIIIINLLLVFLFINDVFLVPCVNIDHAVGFTLFNFITWRSLK